MGSVPESTVKTLYYLTQEGLNWTLQTTESGRSCVKVNGLEIKKWTAQKDKTGWPKRRTLNVMRDESRRSKKLEVDGSKD